MIDRTADYTTTIKFNEELPIEVWAFLVKRRAGFRCEKECDNQNCRMHAHHIEPRIFRGKNTLENGQCLCSKCHGKTRANRELVLEFVLTEGKKLLGIK